MKVLLLNGSPRVNGNTSIVLGEMENVFSEEGIEYENIQVGNLDIRGCTACGACAHTDRCIYDDIVNEIAPKFEESNGLVLHSIQPVLNSAHGRDKGEVRQDEEGLQTMRTLARNMTFLMKSIALGKEAYGLP